jgi:nucleoside-diphosphate-sugar epimerase
MRVFITGATGFIGGHVARKLRERGDEVVALVRSPDKAGELRGLGVELVEGDLSDAAALRQGMEGAGAVIHGAAIYKVGIQKKDRPAMYEANVTGTEHVLDAAIEAGVPRIVYVSTIAVFGNTKGEVVDESYQRDEADGFLSYYDETKYLSHKVAKDRIAKGAPIVIVQPGGVYGPDDHSEVGNMIDQTAKGKLPAKAFPELGLNLVHVEDVADGVLLALDKGQAGESYALGGEITRLGDVIDKVAELSGRKPPRLSMPTPVLKAMSPLGPVLGPVMGFPKNFKEAIASSDNVTYWGKHDKAMSELGYAPRDLETGLKQTLAASR